jgi:hypothetical protein
MTKKDGALMAPSFNIRREFRSWVQLGFLFSICLRRIVSHRRKQDLIRYRRMPRRPAAFRIIRAAAAKPIATTPEPLT